MSLVSALSHTKTKVSFVVNKKNKVGGTRRKKGFNWSMNGSLLNKSVGARTLAVNNRELALKHASREAEIVNLKEELNNLRQENLNLRVTLRRYQNQEAMRRVHETMMTTYNSMLDIASAAKHLSGVAATAITQIQDLNSEMNGRELSKTALPPAEAEAFVRKDKLLRTPPKNSVSSEQCLSNKLSMIVDVDDDISVLDGSISATGTMTNTTQTGAASTISVRPQMTQLQSEAQHPLGQSSIVCKPTRSDFKQLDCSTENIPLPTVQRNSQTNQQNADNVCSDNDRERVKTVIKNVNNICDNPRNMGKTVVEKPESNSNKQNVDYYNAAEQGNSLAIKNKEIIDVSKNIKADRSSKTPDVFEAKLIKQNVDHISAKPIDTSELKSMKKMDTAKKTDTVVLSSNTVDVPESHSISDLQCANSLIFDAGILPDEEDMSVNLSPLFAKTKPETTTNNASDDKKKRKKVDTGGHKQEKKKRRRSSDVSDNEYVDINTNIKVANKATKKLSKENVAPAKSVSKSKKKIEKPEIDKQEERVVTATLYKQGNLKYTAESRNRKPISPVFKPDVFSLTVNRTVDMSVLPANLQGMRERMKKPSADNHAKKSARPKDKDKAIALNEGSLKRKLRSADKV